MQENGLVNRKDGLDDLSEQDGSVYCDCLIHHGMLVVSPLPDIRALGLPDSSAILWLAFFDIYLYLREEHQVVGRSAAEQLSAVTLICPPIHKNSLHQSESTY